MKKLLTLFTLLLTVCSGAWADSVTFTGDELDKDAATKTKGQVTVVSASDTQSLQQWKDGNTKKNAQGVQVNNSADNNAPTVASGTGLQFSVPEGYVITGVSIIATTNNDTNTGPLAFLQWASAFDKTPDSFEQITVPNRGGASAPAAISPASLVSGARAFGLYKRIKVNNATTPTEIPSSSGSSWPSSTTTFYVFSVTVEYEAAGVTKPSFDPESGSSIIKSSGNVTITGATGNTIYYKWSTTDNAYSDGATLADAEDGHGTTTVNAPIPSTTDTWYLYAVANDGENYSDVVKATYTVTNQTYNISYANGGGSGEMSNTIVEEGDDQVLPANTFTRDCYSFAGWVADVNVKIGGATVTAGEIIDDEATIEDVTENITLTAQWTASYASGKYDFQTGATIGTSPSKTVTTTDTDYAAFQIDNLYFSAMKIGYDDGGTSDTGDGDNFNGWKLKTKDATIKFVVESDKLVTIGIGSIGSGGAAKIDYTNLDGESATASFSAGTNHNYLVKGGTLVTITHNGTNGKTVTLKKIFIQDYVPVTISDKKYATFASNSDLDFSGVSGLYAYTATVAGDELTFNKVTEAKAGEGLLLYADVNTSTDFYVPAATDSPAAVDGNRLVRGTGDPVTSAGEHSGEYNYVLSTNGEGDVNFYLANGNTVPTNKAYLKDISAATSSKFFLPTGEDETDGIRSIENSELRIENSDYYNLAGQKVGKDYKGIVIVNGKKMLNK